MTLQLDWPAEAVERVTREAQKQGLTIDAYLLQATLPPRESAEKRDDVGLRQQREEAVLKIRELRKGNILGPGLTIRDLIEEGRRF